MNSTSDGASLVDAVRLDSARTDVVMQAAYEVQALSRLLMTAMDPFEQDADGADIYHCCLVTRGVCDRLARLAGVLMSAVGDNAVATAELEKIVYPFK